MTEGSGSARSGDPRNGCGGSALPQGAGVALATVAVQHVVNLTGRLEVTAPTNTQRNSRAVLAFIGKRVAAGALREFGERAAEVALPLFGLLSRNVNRHRPGLPRLVTN